MWEFVVLCKEFPIVFVTVQKKAILWISSVSQIGTLASSWQQRRFFSGNEYFLRTSTLKYYIQYENKGCIKNVLCNTFAGRYAVLLGYGCTELFTRRYQLQILLLAWKRSIILVFLSFAPKNIFSIRMALNIQLDCILLFVESTLFSFVFL